MHNFNARLQLLKEGEFAQKWIPALTFGAHYKHNADIENIDRSLVLDPEGLWNHKTATAWTSRSMPPSSSRVLPRPVLLNLGGRATKSAHIGLLGFTDGL